MIGRLQGYLYLWTIASLLCFGCSSKKSKAKPDAAATTSQHSGDAAGPPAKRVLGTTVTVAIPRHPPHLNPMLTSASTWTYRIALGPVFEGLTRIDATGKYVPLLASSMRFEAKGRRIKIILRRDIAFHDGRPLTPEDVAFSLKRAISSRTPNRSLRRRLAHLRTVVPLGSLTVILTLSRPDFRIGAVLADVPIMPSHRYKRFGMHNAQLNREPIGTGPYRVTSTKQAQTTVLEAFDGYWGQTPAIKRWVFRTIAQPEQALAALRNGEVDVLAGLHPGYYPKQVESPRFKQRFLVKRLMENRHHTVLFNLRRKALAHTRVRQAIAHGLNREQILRTLRNGVGRALSAPLWAAGPWYDRSLHPRAHSTAKARELLKGLLPKKKLVALVPRDPRSQAIAKQLRTDLAAIGLPVDLALGDFGFIEGRLRRGDFDMAVVSLNMAPNGDPTAFFHSKGGLNYGNYRNVRVDAILEQLRASNEPGAQAALGRELHRELAKNPPLVVVYTPTELMVARKDMRGFGNVGLWPHLSELRLVEEGTQ